MSKPMQSWEEWRKRARAIATSRTGKDWYTKMVKDNPEYPEDWQEVFALIFDVYRLAKGGEQGLYTDLLNFIEMMLARKEEEAYQDGYADGISDGNKTCDEMLKEKEEEVLRRVEEKIGGKGGKWVNPDTEDSKKALGFYNAGIQAALDVLAAMREKV